MTIEKQQIFIQHKRPIHHSSIMNSMGSKGISNSVDFVNITANKQVSKSTDSAAWKKQTMAPPRKAGLRKKTLSLNPEEREALENLVEEVILEGGIDNESASSDEDDRGGDGDGERMSQLNGNVAGRNHSLLNEEFCQNANYGEGQAKNEKLKMNKKFYPGQLKVALKHMSDLPPRFSRKLKKAEKYLEVNAVKQTNAIIPEEDEDEASASVPNNSAASPARGADESKGVPRQGCSAGEREKGRAKLKEIQVKEAKKTIRTLLNDLDQYSDERTVVHTTDDLPVSPQQLLATVGDAESLRCHSPLLSTLTSPAQSTAVVVQRSGSISCEDLERELLHSSTTVTVVQPINSTPASHLSSNVPTTFNNTFFPCNQTYVSNNSSDNRLSSLPKQTQAGVGSHAVNISSAQNSCVVHEMPHSVTPGSALPEMMPLNQMNTTHFVSSEVAASSSKNVMVSGAAQMMSPMNSQFMTNTMGVDPHWMNVVSRNGPQDASIINNSTYLVECSVGLSLPPPLPPPLSSSSYQSATNHNIVGLCHPSDYNNMVHNVPLASGGFSMSVPPPPLTNLGFVAPAPQLALHTYSYPNQQVGYQSQMMQHPPPSIAQPPPPPPVVGGNIFPFAGPYNFPPPNLVATTPPPPQMARLPFTDQAFQNTASIPISSSCDHLFIKASATQKSSWARGYPLGDYNGDTTPSDQEAKPRQRLADNQIGWYPPSNSAAQKKSERNKSGTAKDAEVRNMSSKFGMQSPHGEYSRNQRVNDRRTSHSRRESRNSYSDRYSSSMRGAYRATNVDGNNASKESSSSALLATRCHRPLSSARPLRTSRKTTVCRYSSEDGGQESGEEDGWSTDDNDRAAMAKAMAGINQSFAAQAILLEEQEANGTSSAVPLLGMVQKLSEVNITSPNLKDLLTSTVSNRNSVVTGTNINESASVTSAEPISGHDGAASAYVYDESNSCLTVADSSLSGMVQKVCSHLEQGTPARNCNHVTSSDYCGNGNDSSGCSQCHGQNRIDDIDYPSSAASTVGLSNNVCSNNNTANQENVRVGATCRMSGGPMNTVNVSNDASVCVVISSTFAQKLNELFGEQTSTNSAELNDPISLKSKIRQVGSSVQLLWIEIRSF